MAMVEMVDQRKISEGQKLLDRIDKEKFPIALWVRFDEMNDWKLALVAREYRQKGPIAIYGELHSIIELNNINLNFLDIFLIDSRSSMAAELRDYKATAGASYKDTNAVPLGEGYKFYYPAHIYYIMR